MGVTKFQFNATFGCAAVLLTIATTVHAQSCDRVRPVRAAVVSGTVVGAETIAILIKKDDWWTTPRSGFTVAWDPSANLGQDRYLHALVSYHTSQASALAWGWSCVSHNAAGWLGAAIALFVAIPKEIGDGLHEGNSFSIPDMLAGTVGAALPALHRSVPLTRVAQIKFNYWPSEEYRNATIGQPTLLSDYAGQRYYLAIQPGRLANGAGAWPDWLGVALGHSVDAWILMPARHQWYVTLDVDMAGLPIDAGWWKQIAGVLNQVHFPSPGIRIQDGGVTLGFF